MADSDIDLSICTLATGGPQALRPLLEAIHASAEVLAFEVLVAEKGDAGVTALADHFPGLTVARLGNISRPARLNRLLGLSQGRYVFLLPAGALVEPYCLRRVVDFLDETPDVGLLAPRLMDGEGRTVPTCAEFPWPLAVTGLPWPRPAAVVRRRSGEVDLCLGGCHVLRRELLDEIGPLSPGCGGLMELDLYWRARRRGWHAVFLREAAVTLPPTAARQPGLGRPSPWPGSARDLLAFLWERWFAKFTRKA